MTKQQVIVMMVIGIATLTTLLTTLLPQVLKRQTMSREMRWFVWGSFIAGVLALGGVLWLNGQR